MQKRGLGRGLNDLGLDELLTAVAAPVANKNNGEMIAQLLISALQPGKYQPRRDMDQTALNELAESIKTQGIIQPLIVRPVAENRYEIIAGERRFRAAKLNQMTTVPCIVRNIRDDTALALGLIENIQRENLNPMDEAHALQRLIHEFQLSQEEAAKMVGRSRSAVANILRLLQLHPQVQTWLEHNDLTAGHAKALLTVEPARQVQLGEQIISQHLSVRETEKLTTKIPPRPATSSASAGNKTTHWQALETRLSTRFNLPVQIRQQTNGSGALTIFFSNEKSLHSLLEKIAEH